MNEKNGLSVYSVIEYFKKQLTIMPTIMPISSIVPSTNIIPKPSFTPTNSSGYGNNSGNKNTKNIPITEKSVDRSVDQNNYESKNNNKNENRKSIDKSREKEVVEEFEPEESSRPILAENKKDENKKESRRNQGSRIPQSSQSVKDLGSNAGISTGTGTGVSRVNISVPEAVSTIH